MFLSQSASSSAWPAAALPPDVRARPSFKNLIACAASDFVVPALIYTACFFVLTYPLIRQWSTAFYCNDGDGLQNEWNIWWIRKAILELHQSPWFTTWLHAPRGTTLIGHTLNPINGFVAIPLSFFLTPVQVYNVIVTASFVLSGITAFWLARHVCGSYIPALFGGFAFSFTGYRVAHANGHMQLISTQFIPLFLLAWIAMLERPRIGRAIAAGCVLGLTALCDFYYVFYCIMAGAMCGAFYLAHLRSLLNGRVVSARSVVIRFAVFAFTAAVCCGPLLIPLMLANARDPFNGAHEADIYSADAFSAFIPGGANWLGRLTMPYWSNLTGNVSEQCLYVGVTVLFIACWGAFRFHSSSKFRVWFWCTLAVCSYLFSLGPVLHVRGVAETGPVLPYAWAEQLLPPLRLSGCPGRITVMFALALSVLMTLGISSIWRRRDWMSRLFLIAFALAMAIDLLPNGLPTTPPMRPAWTTALRNLPLPGAVISNVGDDCHQLYYQTLYDRPAAFGYISRIPASVMLQDRQIVSLARSHEFAALRQQFGFVYVVLPAERRLPDLPVVYSDDEVKILELPGPLKSTRR